MKTFVSAFDRVIVYFLITTLFVSVIAYMHNWESCVRKGNEIGIVTSYVPLQGCTTILLGTKVKV